MTKYYLFGDQRVAMRRGSVVYYLHGDHLGSVSLTTDSSGATFSEARYLPYGEERWSYNTSPTDFGFTGQRDEAGFGLMDYNARYYDPFLGRFISPDTVVPEPLSSNGLNRFAYVNNNPVRHTDPTGHNCYPACTTVPIPWQQAIQISVGLSVSAPAIAAPAAAAVAFSAGSYLGASWAMQDMGPANPPNPWTVGWTETFPVGDSELNIAVTPPLAGTSTIGNNVETIPLKPSILNDVQLPTSPKTFGLEFPNILEANHGHHTIPREILEGYLPQDVADAVRGKKGAPNIWPIPDSVHKQIHKGPGGGAYNQRWKEELDAIAGQITAEKILEIRDRLVKEFDIEKYRPK